jgi:hypothetical protein
MDLSDFGFLDVIYYQFFHRIQNLSGDRFFSDGWGDMGVMKQIQAQFQQSTSIPAIKVQWQHDWQKKQGAYWRDGVFETPRYHKNVEDKVARAVFRTIMPFPNFDSPLCIILATTGEEGFEVRQNSLSRALLEQGIGSILLEHPFMGKRRPHNRQSSRFQTFSELILYGGMVVDEARALVIWLHNLGVPKIGLFGISSGGHLAALAASDLKALDIVVPCLAPHSGVVAFTEGLLSRSCDWRALAKASNCSLEEALKNARRLLEFTSIKNFPPPSEGTKIRIVAALKDCFVPHASTEELLRHWPTAKVQWLRGGHVSSIWKKQHIFQNTILNAFGIR